MAYDYASQKSNVFSETGQRMFLSIRDRASRLIANSGAATMQKIISGEAGDSWDMLACVDRLVELGELHEIEQTGRVAGQDRIFIKR